MIARAALAIFVLGVAGLAALPAGAREARATPEAVRIEAGQAQVLFTPWDDVEGALVTALRAARHEVRVQAFSFTSRAIARALIEARGRGVDVQITADAGEIERAEGSRIPDLAAAGVPVFVETRYQSAHNKVMVIDAGSREGVVVTGSYNWTYAAQRRNAENVLIMRGQPALALRYRANWERHRADAQPYVKP